MNYMQSKEYKRHKTQIDNCVLNLPEEKKDEEIKRIIKELQYAEKHTSFTCTEFFMLDFAHKNHAEWFTYLPDGSSRTIFNRMDTTNPSFYSGDKYQVYLKYKKYFKREMCKAVCSSDKESFVAFLLDKGRVMVKPICGSLGDGIEIISKNDIAETESFFAGIMEKYPDGCVAEELITQEESLAKLNPTSVNTLRITTVRMDDRVDAESFLRVGKMFSKVDNVAKGGIVCALDQETGKIIRAIDIFGNIFTAHPHTNMPLVGYTVPRFKEAVALAKELALVLPDYRYMGWDLALTDSGWILVELNAKAGIYCIQQTLGRGIRADFEKYFRELGQPTDFPGAFKADFK